MDIGTLISGSSAFSKSSLYIWKFSVHILVKPSLKDFEHYLASMGKECNCVVFWTFFGIAFLWDLNKTDIFQSCGHCWVFQICWYIECSTLTASSFRIWSSSMRISSPPLTLLRVMLPKAWKVALSWERCRDSWPLEEKNSIWGHWWGLIAQSFCVIKFY